MKLKCLGLLLGRCLMILGHTGPILGFEGFFGKKVCLTQGSLDKSFLEAFKFTLEGFSFLGHVFL